MPTHQGHAEVNYNRQGGIRTLEVIIECLHYTGILIQKLQLDQAVRDRDPPQKIS